MYREKIHTYKKFAEDVKNGKIKNVLLIYGEEEYLVKWAIDMLVKKYINEATRQMDLTILDEMETASSEMAVSIIESCETFPLFSDKRVIIVRDMKALVSSSPQAIREKDLAELKSYFKQVPDTSLLIFAASNADKSKPLSKAIIEAGAGYNFERLGRSDLISFANKRFRQAGKKISNINMNMLIDETGYFNQDSNYDLYTFMNDISKLIAISGDTIEENSIKDLVISDEDTFVFNLLDSIGSGRKDKAFEQLHNILAGGGDEFQLIGTIVSQFELMYSVKQMTDSGMQLTDIAKKLKASEYRIKKFMPQLQRFSSQKLAEILSSAYELSNNITSGLLKSNMALELFIAGF
ncbi:MAG: DNA polymerase III subunit delta [Eubacterium sp.]|nr:DNA polymerase III subunit delta [Eubacterium sp.]